MRDLHVWLWCVWQKRHGKCEKKIHRHDGRDRNVWNRGDAIRTYVKWPHKEFICSSEITASTWTMWRPSADPVFDRKLTISKLEMWIRSSRILSAQTAYVWNSSRFKYVYRGNCIFCWSIWRRGPYSKSLKAIHIHEIAAKYQTSNTFQLNHTLPASARCGCLGVMCLGLSTKFFRLFS